MPRYQKTTKVELWRTGESWQDEAGAWHDGRPTHRADLWANVKGRDYSEYYAIHGTWVKPCIDFTITRPRFTVPRLGDHIRYNGDFYKITQVNELTGQVGKDMRITCELDERFNRGE